MIEQFTIRRRIVPDSALQAYDIYEDGKKIGSQMSYPTEWDCRHPMQRKNQQEGGHFSTVMMATKYGVGTL